MIDHESIRRIRRSRNLTQLRLASVIGRSPSWVCVLESGLGPTPDREVLERIAQALGVPVSEIETSEDDHGW